MTLEEYTKKFKSICDNLVAVTKPFDEEDKVFFLTQGLGPKYGNFKTTMLSKPPSNHKPIYSYFTKS